MAKLNKKVVSLALVPFVAINIFAGCRIAKKNSVASEDKIIESSANLNSSNNGETLVTEQFELEVNSGNYDDVAEVQTLNKDPYVTLREKYKNSDLDYNEIIKSNTNDSDLLASALLEKLTKAGLSDKEIKEEMDKVIATGAIFVGFDNEDAWNLLFGKLQNTLSENENAVDYYYPLAKYVHLAECDLEHEECYEDSNRIYCDNIANKLNEMNDGILYECAVVNEIDYSDNEKIIEQMNTLLNSNLDMEEVFVELDRIYTLSIVPTDFDEETWNRLFSELLKTVGEYDNVCDIYYDLALYAHEFGCNSTHELNEFGTYECEPYRLKLGL